MELKWLLLICMIVCFVLGLSFGVVITHDYFEKKAVEQVNAFYVLNEQKDLEFNLTGGINAIKIQ